MLGDGIDPARIEAVLRRLEEHGDCTLTPGERETPCRICRRVHATCTGCPWCCRVLCRSCFMVQVDCRHHMGASE
jgi:hypothetical protein